MRAVRATVLAALLTLALAAPAAATPVCTDGYKGGPPASLCGGRIFPEADARARLYPVHGGRRSASSSTSTGSSTSRRSTRAGSRSSSCPTSTATMRSAPGPTSCARTRARTAVTGATSRSSRSPTTRSPTRARKRSSSRCRSTGTSVAGSRAASGRRRTSRSAAEEGGKIVDGVDNYESSTGREPKFHEYNVADVLAKEAVYLLDFNVDGWAVGDWWNPPAPSTYTRGNSLGTDLNRQMPTLGRINPNRNPLEESEMRYGTQFMHEVAERGPGRQDGLRRRHPRRDELAGLHGHHVPGRPVRLR